MCSVSIILQQKPYSSFTFKDILTKLYQVVLNIVVHRNISHFFLITIYFRSYLTLCPAKRSLFHIQNFKINFLKIKRKI